MKTNLKKVYSKLPGKKTSLKSNRVELGLKQEITALIDKSYYHAEAMFDMAQESDKAYEKIRALYFRLENSRRLMELYEKDLLPQAAKAMEIAEVWFREGQSSFSDFVEAQAVWYNFQVSLARARADYGKYLARLESVVGQSLS